jgi:hypothetical protein
LVLKEFKVLQVLRVRLELMEPRESKVYKVPLVLKARRVTKELRVLSVRKEFKV